LFVELSSSVKYWPASHDVQTVEPTLDVVPSSHE
jgi:hypothetical protein